MAVTVVSYIQLRLSSIEELWGDALVAHASHLLAQAPP